MAQVITKCRLTGHYMFMGMDADPSNSPRLQVPSHGLLPSVLCMRAFLA